MKRFVSKLLCLLLFVVAVVPDNAEVTARAEPSRQQADDNTVCPDDCSSDPVGILSSNGKVSEQATPRGEFRDAFMVEGTAGTQPVQLRQAHWLWCLLHNARSIIVDHIRLQI